QRLAGGSNPYARVLGGDMRHNESYATYFPAYYLFSAGLYRLGITDYASFLRIWRPICEASYVPSAILLLPAFARERAVALGVFASAFWFFNRWTVAVVNIAHLDTTALLLLLLSLFVYDKRRRTSWLFLGASLAVKQMALFIVPLYLIWAYRDGPDE